MAYVYLFTLGILIALASTLAYRWTFLHQKKIAYLSLIHYIYLVIIPGILFTVIFSFILDILDRPPNYDLFLNDKILTIALLLSIIYTYAGAVTHAICKTLSGCFEDNHKQSLAYKVNKYFHLTFSHNLSFAGASCVAIFLSLLEINHLPSPERHVSYLLPVINGVIMGITFILMIVRYRTFTKNKDISEYFEIKPWTDLKFFFYAFWVVFILFIYGAKPYLKTIKFYPIALTMLVACLEVVILSVFLYTRRLYRKTKVRLSNNHSTKG
jgi:hypothetical protein